MKEGAYIGAVVALLVYIMLPIYGDNGGSASVIPTGYAVSNHAEFGRYTTNLPYSTLIFLAFEVLGISVGIAAQMILKKTQTQ